MTSTPSIASRFVAVRSQRAARKNANAVSVEMLWDAMTLQQQQPVEDACRRGRRRDRNTGREERKMQMQADAAEKKEDEKIIQRAWGSIKLQGQAHRHQSGECLESGWTRIERHAHREEEGAE
jgi:hypothetical protein